MPTDLELEIYVFMLATFVGLEVIRKVSPLLHTPLMSLTNAISAIAVVGAIAITGAAEATTLSRVLGFVAVTASTINVVSGYLITDRMLCGTRGVLETVRDAIAGGVSIVQLRDPTAKTRALVDEARALTPAQNRKIVRRKRHYFDFLRRTLGELKSQKKLRDVDITVAAFSLLGMVNWLSRWYQVEGSLDERAVAAEIVDFALHGLLRPAARGRGGLRAV